MIFSLQAQLSAYRSQAINTDELPRRGVPYRHNIQLEELRNLQDRLQHEKEAWLKERENEERDLEERKVQLLKIQVRKSFQIELKTERWGWKLNALVYRSLGVFSLNSNQRNKSR